MSKGEASGGKLSKPFDVSMPAISRLLKVVKRANLVDRTWNASWRPMQLNPTPLAEITNWLER
ncbi:hypothetical protein [Devosia sp. XK-2]|uniref:ArsR/SmtB family transcription factor n=1 Tax=Devosia sp. XK-2 TaxID=3126689 RepID=UPI0030CB655E